MLGLGARHRGIVELSEGSRCVTVSTCFTYLLTYLPSIRCALNSDSNVFTGRCEEESNAPGDGGASRESQRCASASLLGLGLGRVSKP